MPKAGIGTVGLHPFLDHPSPHLGTSLGGAGHIDEVPCRAVAPTSSGSLRTFGPKRMGALT